MKLNPILLDESIALFQAGEATFAWLCAQADIVFHYAYHCLLEWEEETGRSRYTLTKEEIKSIFEKSSHWRWRRDFGRQLRSEGPMTEPVIANEAKQVNCPICQGKGYVLEHPTMASTLRPLVGRWPDEYRVSCKPCGGTGSEGERP